MDSLSAIFGMGSGIVGVVLIILVLLVVGFVVFRMINQPVFGSNRRNKQARLAVTDAITFGKKHKLLLLRRDDIEHLVLIGGPTDIVVESNIRRNAAVRPRETPAKEPEVVVTPAPAVASSSGSDAEPVSAPEPKKEPSAPARLRPVANETPPKPERPQFVPRQEPVASPPPAAPEQRSATAVATPHVRPTPQPQPPTTQPQSQESPFADQPAVRTASAPAVQPSVKEPAVVGGLVAAPITASVTGGSEEQESPFKDPVPDTRADASSDRLSVVEKPVDPFADDTTTVAPGSQPEIAADRTTATSGSVADDMDALLKELGAKR